MAKLVVSFLGFFPDNDDDNWDTTLIILLKIWIFFKQIYKLSWVLKPWYLIWFLYKLLK